MSIAIYLRRIASVEGNIRPMSPRARARVLVGVAAAVSAAVVVGVTLLQSEEGDGPEAAASTTAERTAPPLELGLLLRDDPEARALRAAERLNDQGQRADAAARFEAILAENPESVEAAVGAAVSAWPDGTEQRLEQLVAENPASGVARLHLGLALLAAGDEAGALRQLREVESRDPDSPAALRAEDILHPEIAPGRPPFVAPLQAPDDLRGLAPEKQLAALRKRARAGGVEDRLLYGSALQRVGMPVSAREAFLAAAAVDPESLEAQVAAAIGRFDKDDPSQTFSRLGPLAREDRNGVVRYHLGLALSWLGQLQEALRQLRLASDEDPDGFYGREAKRLLERLESAGS
jgi:tetratricopeptide (TPR) repeat protein